MIANRQSQFMSPEEYLEWEQYQEVRHEYLDGEVIAMTGGSLFHNDIALNLYTALRPHVRARGCRINVSDAKVKVNALTYCYPDLVVSCDNRDRTATQLFQSPKLIVEVLSPSTEAYDRGKKFTQYRTLPTLQEYVLIDTTEMSVDCYRRGEGRQWWLAPYTVGDTLTLESVDFSCAIELLYEDVQLESPPSS
jgi:Uma2 family endonuclease